MFGMGMGMGMGHGGGFADIYRCHSVSLFAAEQQRDPERLEAADKIILPPSALEKLAHLEISYPMMFELTNPHYQELRLHCGVLEFIAQEGMIYLPYWIMENLHLQEGDMLHVRSATIPKGTYVKLQPQTSDFVKISNPKAVLEATLRNFSALTKGEVIRIFYNKKKYDIGVVEVKPEGGRFPPRQPEAVCIIEADVQVDFAPPADHVEPQATQAAAAQPARPVVPAADEAPPPDLDHDSSDDEKTNTPKFTGAGNRLDGKAPNSKQRRSLGAASNGSPGNGSDAHKPAPMFRGASGTLSGKVVDVAPAVTSDPAAQVLGKGNAFGPALARTAELRKAAEEREKRAAAARGEGPTSGPSGSADNGAGDGDGATDYWATLGSGNKLR